MRYPRIISRSLSRRLNPIPPNPTQHHSHFPQFILPRNPSFTRLDAAGPWTCPNLARELTSAAQEPEKPVISDRVSAIVDELVGLPLLEVAEVTELLRQKLGVGEMPAMAVMMPGMGLGVKRSGGGAAKAEEKVEKTAFDLKLEAGFDAAVKIKIIKEVRACTNLGLREAKELVEKAPAVLKKGVPKEEAEQIIAKLKEAGGKVVME
ncbi:hypothetical protein RJ639_041833 [Escallonia herrerae]|uniref:Large ribosomal subunit protein bL12c n=1 Tax=Escallonia herrerae TaxID=1293975 RepID=A0AA89BBD6_9ASTE|nr:hypothetical protein RJ639_041833 [Escallonia herrerae]